MKPTLEFVKKSMLVSDFGADASVPSIFDIKNLQNRTSSDLDEDDGLFIGYGKLKNAFPYRQKNAYSRELADREVETAVLENDFLKATFLPEFGGRLWSLIDKETGKNLLYTNDVIRPSNLSVRNAWFSGGVEWNIGVIGHTPTTTEPLFTAKLQTPDGDPVLRMYEYERIRGVTWQMDFWLTESSKFLICRMRIQNDNDTLRPMYWWSNIAVPEHKGGRLIAPAYEAYTHSESDGTVVKVATPDVDGIDISFYENIPLAVDYFFDLTDLEEKYIASFDSDGFGLMQTSTARMRGRKLFSWGHTNGARKWQDFLTEDAGDYIEIQAGVERTQYGCVPMPPKTVWEWVELYGKIEADPEKLFNSYEIAEKVVTNTVREMVDHKKLEKFLIDTKETIAKKPAKVLYNGSPYGALENMRRKNVGLDPIAPHIDFGEVGKSEHQWVSLLENGYFEPQNPDDQPGSYMAQDEWYRMLEDSVEKKNHDNWYAWYQLGLMEFSRDNFSHAERCLEKSLELENTCWALHGLSVLYGISGESEKSIDCAAKALLKRPYDLAVAKDCMHLLYNGGAYQKMIDLSDEIDKSVVIDGRIQMLLCAANLYLGNLDEADRIMHSNGGLIVTDIREGEELLGEIWIDLEKAKNPDLIRDEIKIPMHFDFRMHTDE